MYGAFNLYKNLLWIIINNYDNIRISKKVLQFKNGEENMVKIWGKLIKENKIIRDEVAESNIDASYQENLKACIIELCDKFDISKPYWLPNNLEEFNRRAKTEFNSDNFIEELDFDKFVIEELDLEKNNS